MYRGLPRAWLLRPADSVFPVPLQARPGPGQIFRRLRFREFRQDAGDVAQGCGVRRRDGRWSPRRAAMPSKPTERRKGAAFQASLVNRGHKTMEFEHGSSTYRLDENWPKYPPDMQFEMGSGVTVDDDGIVYLFTRDV